MIRSFAILAGLLTLTALAACSPATDSACQAGDWRALGVSDGARGRPLTQLAHNQERCDKYGVKIDKTLYLAGRTEGLKQYCILNKAKSVGEAGLAYYNVCTGEVGASFSRVYKAANKVKDLENQKRAIRSDIAALNAQLHKPGLSDAQRAAILAQISALENRLARRVDRLRDARQDLDDVLFAERQRLKKLGLTG